jgi:hypothetical protein
MGFCFISKECEQDYVWVMERLRDHILGGATCPNVIATDQEIALTNAIEYVFPDSSQLLCVRHYEQNVLKNCRKCFVTDDDFQDFIYGCCEVFTALQNHISVQRRVVSVQEA